jgi:hypothetical protein
MNAPPAPPRHHELPQRYLKGFCESSKLQLWEFRRDGGVFKPGKKRSCNPRERGIRSIALRPDGYVAYHENGVPHYDYEAKLQQQEEHALPALLRILDLKAVGASEKEALADYIWLTFRRVTRHDGEIEPLLNEKLSALSFEDAARRLAYAGQFGDAHKLLSAQQFLQSNEGKASLLREYVLRQYGVIRDQVLDRPWALHVAPRGAFFLTNDAPVIFDRERPLALAPLYFPLNRRVLLEVQLAGDRDLEYADLSNDQTMAMNKLIIGNAIREVYSPRGEEWIHRELTSSVPRTSLIP